MLALQTLRNNLETVQSRIESAAQRAGRNDRITLVVVTKGHGIEAIRVLAGTGVNEIGESYVQEALGKQEQLSDQPAIHWHLIGHVQSRKAEDAAGNFSLVHSVDSLKLARRLDRFAGQTGRELPILLELNVGGEAAKYGWPASTDSQFAANLTEIDLVLQLPNLKVHGLMCIAPMTDNSEQARPFFERTRSYRDQLSRRFPAGEWGQLSMGMSDDFEAAILEGATLLRVGTAILGPRPR
ncbi:MAG: YggS family pyridoxal phosphate-dependent enzyme [Anaerolineales bacterium]